MTRLYLDLETYSEVDIKAGTHAYAEKAEILLFAWAIDDGPVSVWDCTTDTLMPDGLREALANPAVEVWAHNSHFDRTILRHVSPPHCPPVERWRDTMAKAYAHGLPGSLGMLCEILGVPNDKAKDKAGKQLIQLFCKPRPKNMKLRRATRATHPIEWNRFISYAGDDIIAMREVDQRLPRWNYRNAELDLWHLDQRINDRGVCVDLDLARGAVATAERERGALAARADDLSDGAVASATQRDALLEHLLEIYGIELPDLRASTIERRLDDPDLPWAVKELLLVRLDATTTSVSKYNKLIKATSSDGRLRGTLQYCGASRTGRWAGRVFQPQNLPRPTHKQKVIEETIAAIKADVADALYDDVMPRLSSCIRGVLVAPPGRKLVVADLSNIEGRMLAWLAGEEWKLQAFRDFDSGFGADLYALAYAKAFGVTPEAVMDNKENGDGSMRQIGKVMELALGYEGGVGAFITFAAAYRIDLEALALQAWENIPANVWAEAESAYEWTLKQKRPTYGLSPLAWKVCESFKRLWRYAHPETATFWRELDNAARRAVAHEGTLIVCRRLKLRRDGNWLRIQLPSGRALCYPGARVESDGKISYMGVHQYTRQWTRLYTYGGKLVENVTQAAARDVMAAGMQLASRDGYDILLTVHDELITESPDRSVYNHLALAKLMATNPEWSAGLPLAAAGFEAYRYRKD